MAAISQRSSSAIVARTCRGVGARHLELFEGLAGRHHGVFGGCWCIYFHPDGPERGQGAEANRELKKRYVEQDKAHDREDFQAPGREIRAPVVMLRQQNPNDPRREPPLSGRSARPPMTPRSRVWRAGQPAARAVACPLRRSYSALLCTGSQYHRVGECSWASW